MVSVSVFTLQVEIYLIIIIIKKAIKLESYETPQILANVRNQFLLSGEGKERGEKNEFARKVPGSVCVCSPVVELTGILF